MGPTWSRTMISQLWAVFLQWLWSNNTKPAAFDTGMHSCMDLNEAFFSVVYFWVKLRHHGDRRKHFLVGIGSAFWLEKGSWAWVRSTIFPWSKWLDKEKQERRSKQRSHLQPRTQLLNDCLLLRTTSSIGWLKLGRCTMRRKGTDGEECETSRETAAKGFRGQDTGFVARSQNIGFHHKKHKPHCNFPSSILRARMFCEPFGFNLLWPRGLTIKTCTQKGNAAKGCSCLVQKIETKSVIPTGICSVYQVVFWTDKWGSKSQRRSLVGNGKAA